MRSRLLSIVCVCLWSLVSMGQQKDDMKLAKQFYESGEFQKAADLFSALYKSNQDDESMQFYVRCLLSLKKEIEVEKFLKKIARKNNSSNAAIVSLASLYASTERPAEAMKLIKARAKSFDADQSLFINLSGALQAASLPDLGIAVLQAGQEKMGFLYPFYFELAEMYSAKKDLSNMIDQYLEAINYNEGYLVQVQNALQTNLDDENSPERRQLLKQQLLKKIQQYPQREVFTNMLVWLFQQEKNFLAAFEQLRALDKRFGNKSPELFELAQVASANQDFAAAADILQYELTKGRKNPYYDQARREYISNQYLKLSQSPVYTQIDLQQTDSAFAIGLNELGIQPSTASMVRDFAHFKAFYLSQQDTALSLLDEVIQLPAVDDVQRTRAKLEKADVLLFTGDVWEASLLYSQVEKNYKHDVLGQEAKFRNARLSYYRGDFEWAQAQLLVLKAATSKLIANDALDLSMIITDNLGQDSVREPLQMFARGDLFLYQNKDSLALLSYDSISRMHPFHGLSDEVLFRKYTIAAKHQSFKQALVYLEEIAGKYNEEIYADDACYLAAEIYFIHYKDTQAAMKWYQELITKYPGSIYAADARVKFRKLRGDNIN